MPIDVTCAHCGRVFPHADLFCTKVCSNRHRAQGGPRLPLAQRIARDTSFTPTATGCMLWTGSLSASGYGVCSGSTVRLMAHRASWCLFHWGADITYADVKLLPRYLAICHTCDVPACVNPEHLFVATHEMNLHDAASKGRMNKSELTLEDIPAIRAAHAAGQTGSAIARRYGLDRSSIEAIVKRRAYQHVP
jgi:hypothetical protein